MKWRVCLGYALACCCAGLSGLLGWRLGSEVAWWELVGFVAPFVLLVPASLGGAVGLALGCALARRWLGP